MDIKHAFKEAKRLYARNEIKLRQIPDFILGTIRKIQFYYWKPWKPSSVAAAIYLARLRAIRPSCFSNAACDECGCAIPGLNFVARSCKGNCYPPVMRSTKRIMRKYFKRYQSEWPIDDVNTHVWRIELLGEIYLDLESKWTQRSVAFTFAQILSQAAVEIAEMYAAEWKWETYINRIAKTANPGYHKPYTIN